MDDGLHRLHPHRAVAVGVIAHFYGGRGALAAGVTGCVLAVIAGAAIIHQHNMFTTTQRR